MSDKAYNGTLQGKFDWHEFPDAFEADVQAVHDGNDEQRPVRPSVQLEEDSPDVGAAGLDVDTALDDALAEIMDEADSDDTVVPEAEAKSKATAKPTAKVLTKAKGARLRLRRR